MRLVAHAFVDVAAAAMEMDVKLALLGVVADGLYVARRDRHHFDHRSPRDFANGRIFGPAQTSPPRLADEGADVGRAGSGAGEGEASGVQAAPSATSPEDQSGAAETSETLAQSQTRSRGAARLAASTVRLTSGVMPVSSARFRSCRMPSRSIPTRAAAACRCRSRRSHGHANGRDAGAGRRWSLR